MTKQLLNLHTLLKITLILTTLFLLPSNLLAQNTYSYGNNVNISYDNNSSVYWDENHTYVWNVSMTGGEATSYGFRAFETLSLTFTEPLKGKLSSLNFQSSIITSENNVNINVYKLDKFEGGTRTLIGPITISTSGTGSATPEYVFDVNSGTALFDNQYIQIAFERIDQNKSAVISANAVEGIVLTFNGTAYPLYVGNYRVTSNNADNIFGDSEKTASYTYNDENSNGTLTLKGANINGSISSGSYLDVILTGNNTITSTTGEGDFYAFRNSNTTNIQIDLKTDENNPGTLKIVGIKDNSYISTSTCSEQFTHGTVGDKTWKEEYGEENDISYLLLSLNKKYKLWKNGIQYHDLGLENNDGFSFDPGTSTLTITNSCDSIRSGLPELTIAINGEVNIGTVKGEFSTSLYETGKCSLTITKDPESESVNNSLTLNSEDGVITGFKSVIIDNSLHIIEPETTPKTWDKNIHKAVISDDIPYDIWINNYRFTKSKPNGGFSGEISYDDNTHTLSLGGISYSPDAPEIRSCLPELIIKLKNSNSLSKITFDNEHASGMNSTLIFEKDGDTSDSYNLSIDEISGFKDVIYRNGLGKKTIETSQQGGSGVGISYIIEPMTAPDIAFVENGVKLLTEYEGDIIYSYDYAKGDITDIENSKYDNSLISLVPGTITAYIQNSEDNTSPIAKGKYFEFASPLTTTYDGEERILEEDDLPELLPKVEGMEYSISYPEINNVIGSTVVSDVTKLTICGLGKAFIEASIMSKDSYDFEILNENGDGRIELEANVIPSAPEFNLAEGTYDEAKTLELTAPYKKSETDNLTTVKIKYYLDGDSENPIQYSDQISISKSSTITAWVEVQVKSAEGGAPITYESEKVTKEYTIKQEANIAFKQESNGGFVDIEAGTTITSTYGHVAPKIMLYGTSDLKGTFVFTSSNENVVASSSISKVFNEEQEVTLLDYTIKGVGETTITAQYTPSNDEPLLTKTISFSLKVNARNISDATFTLSNTSFTYTGSPIEPETTVYFAATATTSAATLNKDNDYNISYIQINGELETPLETAPTNFGSYKVVVEGKGNYTGSATATFTITKATITPTVTLEGWTYGATANEPSVTGNSGSGVVSYAYKLQHAAEEAYSATKPTNAGAYTVKASIAATANYEAATDSAHFTIAKAAGGLTYSAATASAELNGDGWTAPNLDNPNKLTVTYTSSNTAVATISETGIVTLVGTGEATIKAASDGDANHEASETQYTLTVTRGRALGYGVWIGDIEVNEDNLTDILDDGVLGDDGEYTKAPSFIFNPEENTLLIINSNAELTIESRMPELKIHLSNDNKLKKVFYNNIGNPENKGTLLFTCDSNYPGSVSIGNTAGESAITGFSSVGYEFNLQALKPEKAKYANGQMTDSLGVVADTIIVGVPLEPIKSDDKEELNADDFTVNNPDGSTATVDLSSTNVNNIYYTLPESTEGQGYDPETNTISVVDPMTDEAVEQIAAATTSNSTTVGSNDYAENFIGLTFIVQGGEGVIRIDQETEDGYEFHLKIGDSPSITLKSGKEEIAYSLPDATYCWLYLVKSGPARATTRVGKRDHIPGNIRLVSVKANAVASTKPVKTVSGGSISPAVNIAITGIVEIEKDTPENKYDVETVNDKWYTIDGRPINKPSQKGIYIRNRKKVVVK